VLDEVTTHLDSDTVLALVEALREFEGALLVITHDRFFMRCVVEGDSPYDIGDSEDEEAVERKARWQPKPGIVYRLVKSQLKLMEGGMRGYEAIALKASAKPLR
jgi:ATP-binding cassette, subfamily F, member 3